MQDCMDNILFEDEKTHSINVINRHPKRYSDFRFTFLKPDIRVEYIIKLRSTF